MGVITGILLGILILIAGGTLLVKYAVNQVSLASNQTNQTASSQTVTKPTVTVPTNSTPVTPSTPAITSSSSDKVNFDVRITNFTGDGLTRTITAEIANTSSQDAHNVNGKIEVYSGGKHITISGQSSISQALGAIKAGQKMTTQVDLTFGFFDGLTLAQNGATVNLVITSDEKTQTITFDYKP